MKKFIIILFFCAHLSPFLFAQEKSEKKDMYKVEIEDVRNDNGQLHILLYDSPDGFPEDPDKAFRMKTVDASEDIVTVVFDDVPPGRYAFTILHDENGNGKMDKNFLGIPKEGYAYSNDYNPKSEKPVFEDAEIKIEPGSPGVRVSMNYYL